MNLANNPLDFLFAFFGGVAISLTPCVYPLIPAMAGYVTASSLGSKRTAFLLALIYASGVAISYAALGVIASLTGSVFGRLSANPWVLLVAALVFIVFGLSMFGLFNLALPAFFKVKPAGNKGYFSTLVFGAVSGFTVSPCITPALGTILTYIATKKNIISGAGLMLAFAYGMCMSLILIGVFSASLLRVFPKPGKWMLYVKRACALLIIGVGLYFIISALRGL